MLLNNRTITSAEVWSSFCCHSLVCSAVVACPFFTSYQLSVGLYIPAQRGRRLSVLLFFADRNNPLLSVLLSIFKQLGLLGFFLPSFFPFFLFFFFFFFFFSFFPFITANTIFHPLSHFPFLTNTISFFLFYYPFLTNTVFYIDALYER